jgi:hypothetical protein
MIEGVRHLFDAHFGQVAERSVVDADDGHVAVIEQARGGDHRAVAAEHDDHVHAGGEFLVLHRLDGATHLAFDLFALDARAEDERDAARREPFQQATDGFVRLRVMRFDKHADASNVKFLHQPHTLKERDRTRVRRRCGARLRPLPGNIFTAKSGSKTRERKLHRMIQARLSECQRG